MVDQNFKIAVVGAGAWGTALALSLRRSGRDAFLFGRNKEFIDNLAKTRDSRYLPGVKIDENLGLSSSPKDLSDADLVFWVAPAQHTPEFLDALLPYMPPKAPVVSCSKGLYLRTGQALSEIFKSKLFNPVGVLSGPNFAHEIANDLPAAATLAFEDLDLAKRIAARIRHGNFRVYASDDVKGVELCGALKNVVAIAAGIALGKNLGANCLACLITRANAEIARIIANCGGKAETALTLAGIGDLTLTCSSAKSRNTSFGVKLAQGMKPAEILAERVFVTEGVPTAQAAFRLVESKKIRAPIISAVYDILYNEVSVDTAIDALLNDQSDAE